MHNNEKNNDNNTNKDNNNCMINNNIESTSHMVCIEQTLLPDDCNF